MPPSCYYAERLSRGISQKQAALGLIRNGDIGPVLRNDFPSGKQVLNLTDENFNIRFYSFPNMFWPVKTISSDYFKVFIFCDFGDEFRRVEDEKGTMVKRSKG